MFDAINRFPTCHGAVKYDEATGGFNELCDECFLCELRMYVRLNKGM